MPMPQIKYDKGLGAQIDANDSERAKIEIGFYCATRGLYCHNSFITDNDRQCYKEIVKIVRNSDFADLRNLGIHQLNDKMIDKILSLYKAIESAYQTVKATPGHDP